MIIIKVQGGGGKKEKDDNELESSRRGQLAFLFVLLDVVGQ